MYNHVVRSLLQGDGPALALPIGGSEWPIRPYQQPAPADHRRRYHGRSPRDETDETRRTRRDGRESVRRCGLLSGALVICSGPPSASAADTTAAERNETSRAEMASGADATRRSEERDGRMGEHKAPVHHKRRWSGGATLPVSRVVLHQRQADGETVQNEAE